MDELFGLLSPEQQKELARVAELMKASPEYFRHQRPELADAGGGG